MLIFLLVLFVFALVTFGAVQPHIYFGIEILWFIGIVSLIGISIYKDRRLKTHHALLVLLAIALHFVDVKFAVGSIAVAWAWIAAKTAPNRILRFFRLLIVIGVLEALLGLIQYFVEPGWILGYHNPYYVSSGTLINRNHFAGLLGMFIPITLGLSYISIRHGDTARAYVYLVAGGFMAIALIFSMSRMGIFSFFMTLVVLALVLRSKESRTRVFGLALILAGLAIAASLWIGLDVVLKRYAEIGTEEGLLLEGRLVVFRDTARMIGTQPLGIGIGRFVDIYRQHQTYNPSVLVDHAHNDYLETAAEWGVLLAAMFWVAVVFVLVAGCRRLLHEQSVEEAGILIACLGSILSILLHSFTDFNLQIPSNAMIFFTFVGIAAQKVVGRQKPNRSVPLIAPKQHRAI